MEWTFSRDIDEIKMLDVPRRKHERIGFLGATSGYVDSVDPDYQSYP